MKVEEIMVSMKSDIDKYKSEYEQLGKELTSTAKEYQEKIDDLGTEQKRLLEEGNKKLEDIKLRRERISGMYASLYNQYTLLSQKIQKDNTEDVVSKKEEEPHPIVAQGKKKRTVNKSTGLSVLSEEEKAIIKKVTPQAKSSTDNDYNSEIPDYLREEYKK